MTDLSKFNGAGKEDLSVNEIPFLTLLQDMSPAVKSGPDQIPGAKAGLILDVEGNIFDSISVIPIGVNQVYVEWVPRTKGGGYVGTHDIGIRGHADYRKDGIKEFLGDNDLIYTTYVTVRYKGEKDKNEYKVGVISFTSTQLKTARSWIKAINTYKDPKNVDFDPPIFYRSFILKSEFREKNNYSWFSWVVKPGTINPMDDLESSMKLVQDSGINLTAQSKSLPVSEEDKPF